ncbi:VanZ family protein [Mycetocola zhadangensis]|uniref:VanZ family protein n=1 Tax=Mycetocola zhadangensis TaxID=1164595 RepID=A0A3L7ISW3_9MICO|nr:VanZ family protein [Mycetocola zhadangensis]RLQ81324.1 VanZ family protein [Mycetocola zhadangensis]
MLHRHPILGLLTTVYLAFVGWVTLGPQPLDESNSGFIFKMLRVLDRYEATAWINYNTLEFSANVAMFFPIGLFLVLLFGRRLWWLAMALGCGITVVIETAQLFIPGRVSDPRDLVANSAGAILGVLIGLLLTARKARQLREAKAARAAQAARPPRARSMAGSTR